jgi:DNA-binding CsgD family transcriptional regulator
VEAAEISASEDGETAAVMYRQAADRLSARNFRLAAATLTMLSLIAHYDPAAAAEFRHQAQTIGGPLYTAYLDAREAQLHNDPDGLVAAAQILNRHGAHDEAARFLTTAVKLYRSRRQEAKADHARELVHSILSSPTSARDMTPAERIGLTARETELISLIAQGLSNVDIGERLNVSVRTVEAHLRNIRKKTGTVARNDLARLASRPARDR